MWADGRWGNVEWLLMDIACVWGNESILKLDSGDIFKTLYIIKNLFIVYSKKTFMICKLYLSKTLKSRLKVSVTIICWTFKNSSNCACVSPHMYFQRKNAIFCQSKKFSLFTLSFSSVKWLINSGFNCFRINHW